MYKGILFCFLSVLFLSCPFSYTKEMIGLNVSGDKEGLEYFYFSIGNYYKVPEKEVIIIKQKGIPDDEIPVVFFIANCAKVKPVTILDLRLKNMTWMDITLKYGLKPEIFYIPIKLNPGPPYGKAYGYFKKPRNTWDKIVLTNDEIINLVNLKFISEYHGYALEEVIKMRSSGKKFNEINYEIQKIKNEKNVKKGKSETEKHSVTEKKFDEIKIKSRGKGKRR